MRKPPAVGIGNHFEPVDATRLPNGSLPNNRWQGSWQDTTTGLYYVIARWYTPTLGSFVSNDPLPGDTDSPQLRDSYTYGGGDAVDRVDLNGLSSNTCTYGGCTSETPDPCISGGKCGGGGTYVPVISFTQGFWMWGQQQIRASSTSSGCGHTMAEWGCAITSLAMIAVYWGRTLPGGMNPGTLNAYLGANRVISKSTCDISSWSGAGKKLSLKIRKYTFGAVTAWSGVRATYKRMIIEQLRAQHPLIAYVHWGPVPRTKFNKVQTHFVVIRGLTGSNLIINDPGDKGTLLFGTDAYGRNSHSAYRLAGLLTVSP